MISFSHPELLLLALLLPPLAWWWIRHRRGALRHPLAGSLVHLPAGQARVAFWGGLVLRLVALACLVLAAAGLRWPDLRTRIQTEGIAILMVADRSGSMRTEDFVWQNKKISRLDVVKEVFRLFVAGGQEGGTKLEGRPTDRIGLLGFGDLPEMICPLTLSHSALLRLAAEMKPLPAGEAETNIVDATIRGLNRLRKDATPRKVLIVLSDGEDSFEDRNRKNPSENRKKRPSDWKLSKVIQAAKAQEVPIYTIDAAGSGVSDSARPAASTEVRETAVWTLRQLAEGTGGQYFRADNTEALLNVYQVIDRKERAPIESNQYRRYHEGYPWLAAAAFGLFSLVLALEMTLWRRVP